MKDEVVLQPCPFCGSANDDLDTVLEKDDEGVTFWFSFCGDCGAQGPTSDRLGNAQRLWNLRAGKAALTIAPIEFKAKS